MGKKWRVSFYVYADANVDLCIQQWWNNYTRSWMDCNSLEAGKWQLATMTLDLRQSYSSVDRIEWGVAGVGKVYTYRFALVQDINNDILFNRFDERNIWWDIRNQQPAAFTHYYTSHEADVQNIGIVYGGSSESIDYETFTSRHMGLNQGKNYFISFEYQTLEDTGANPGFFKLRSESTGHERCYYNLPNTGGSWVQKACGLVNLAYEDYVFVFGERSWKIRSTEINYI